MDFLQKINAVWQKIGVVQRALLIAIVMACVVTGVLLTKWATKADMRLLYKGLAPEEAAQIVDNITEADIPYKLTSGGTTIYVPNDKVYQLRLRMAKDGLPTGSQSGYEILENEKIGVSPLVQQLNKNRAMQEEMAKTIQMIDGVDYARVHLVHPEQSIYSTGTENATASVMLQLKTGWRLSGVNIAAITNIVAGATEGLSAENVTVVNSRGELLTSRVKGNDVVSGANTFMDYKDRVEQNLANKVQDMLETVLGPGRASVKISAVLDMESIITETKTYQKGIATRESMTTTSKEQGGGANKEGKEAAPGNLETEEKVENEFKLPEIISRKIDVPGKIKSLSVAAVVDLAKPAPAISEENAEEQTSSTTEPELIMTVAQVKNIIRNAVGPELLKDDGSLTVENVSFVQPIVATAADSAGYEKMTRYIEIARHSSMGVMAICALLVLKVFTGAKKKAAAEGPAQASGQINALSMGMLPAGEEGSTEAFRRHIAGELKDNPQQVKQLFASWLAEDR